MEKSCDGCIHIDDCEFWGILQVVSQSVEALAEMGDMTGAASACEVFEDLHDEDSEITKKARRLRKGDISDEVIAGLLIGATAASLELNMAKDAILKQVSDIMCGIKGEDDETVGNA